MNNIEYLLNVLGEECSEVHHRCSKAMRFGLDEVQPGQELNNARRLHQEVCDIYAVLEMLHAAGVNIIHLDRGLIEAKKRKVFETMELSRSLGILKDES